MNESTTPDDDQPVEPIWQVSQDSETLPPPEEFNDDVGHFPPSDPTFDRTPEPAAEPARAANAPHEARHARATRATSEPTPSNGSIWAISEESETLPAENEIGEEVGERPPSDPSFPQD